MPIVLFILFISLLFNIGFLGGVSNYNDMYNKTNNKLCSRYSKTSEYLDCKKMI